MDSKDAVNESFKRDRAMNIIEVADVDDDDQAEERLSQHSAPKSSVSSRKSESDHEDENVDVPGERGTTLLDQWVDDYFLVHYPRSCSI